MYFLHIHIYCTLGGDDGWLCIWNCHTQTLNNRIKIPSPIRTIDITTTTTTTTTTTYAVAVGTTGGSVLLYHLSEVVGRRTEAFQSVIVGDKDVTQRLSGVLLDLRRDRYKDISDIKFSCNMVL